MMNNKKNLNKHIIVENIFKKTGLPKNYINKIIKSLIQIISLGLISDKNIKINNFGTFNLLSKNERIGRNPKNKKEVLISRRNVVTFKSSTFLKQKINKL
jgi:integration host factor subunit alpha